MDTKKAIAAAEELAREFREKKVDTAVSKKKRSLPITEPDRLKREHQAAEHVRLDDVHGDVTITRNDDNYITKIEKVAEDVVVEETIKRDADNYVTGTETRIRIKKAVS